MGQDRSPDVWDRLAAKDIEHFTEEAHDRAETLRGLKLESPIEAMFLAAFINVRGWGQWSRVFDTDDPGDDRLAYMVDCGRTHDSMTRYDIWPQWKVGRFRVDFMIERVEPWASKEDGRWKEGPVARVVVECDGHDFHERTKAQAKRDRSRDRALQTQGLMVLRYTGSELHADANACAVEVCRALSGMGRQYEAALRDQHELEELRKKDSAR